MSTNVHVIDTRPSDWNYISEGGSSIVFSYSGPSNPTFDGTALRLRKVPNHEHDTIIEPGQEEPDDPTIVFQHRVIQRLVPAEYVPRLETVHVERTWLEQLATSSEERRPAERRAKDRIDLGKRKAVLATDLVGGAGWAVEIKPKWGFLPNPTHLSPETITTKTQTCRFCMHSHLKTTEGEDASLGYCPLDLYSGDTQRVTKALISLWDAWIGSSGSVNNLRVFVQGQMLKPSTLPSSLRPLAQQVLPPEVDAPLLETVRDEFITTLLPILLETPVLETLSTQQRSLDALDVEGLSTLWSKAHTPTGATSIPRLGADLTQPTVEDWERFISLYRANHYNMNHDHPDPADLQYYCYAYLLSASFKDCSIILRMVPSPDGKTLKKSITVIDLDVKGVDRLHKWEKLDRQIVEAYSKISDPVKCSI